MTGIESVAGQPPALQAGGLRDTGLRDTSLREGNDEYGAPNGAPRTPAEWHAKRSPSEVDKHVGARVKARRKELGLSQEALAQALGVSFQQVQKYERGVNRVGAGRLFQLAAALGVDVGYFYWGLPTDREGGGGDGELREGRQAPLERPDPASNPASALADTPEGRELAQAMARIQDPALRRQVLDLANTLAKLSDAGGDTGDGSGG